MFGYKEINLRSEKGKKLFYNKSKIDKSLNELETIMQNCSEEIEEKKIKKLLDEKDDNLRDAYFYILMNQKITEKDVRNLYQIIINNSLDDYSIENMGDFYRKEEVFIWNDSESILPMIEKGFSKEKVDKSMKNLFQYMKIDDINDFLKSQIIHYYFIYVHPYFDGNGRTARTLSCWYLFNQKKYLYVSLLDGINHHKTEYIKSIQKSKKGNITPFLEFMINVTKDELEKEIEKEQLEESSKVYKKV